MTRIMSAAVALGVLSASATLAQTAPTTSVTQPSATTSSPSATAPPTALTPPSTTATVPPQSATAPSNSTSTAPSAVSTSNADSKTAAAPVPGANSFTEGEARSRLESHGYSNVTGLTKDDQSIWRGKAMKDGKSVDIALDYQGNIVAH